MNGYGQQMITPEQYAQALTAFDTLQGRQDMQQQIAQTGNPYALIGSALSNLAANKLGKFKDTSITDASEQIRQFQEQKAAELQRIKEAKAQKEAQAAYERKKADELEKFQREQGGKKELAQLNAQLRPQQQGFNERMFNQLSPEQKQSYMNQFAGVQKQGNQLFTSEEQALISQGAVTPEQLVQKKANDALGVKPDKGPTGEARNKLGLLETAERDLQAYISEAFSPDGDYKEVGSKFGGTNSKLKSAVMNALRAESGAAIGDKEVDNFMSTYGPSMFSSDETNMKKVQLLVDKIKTQKQAIGGQQATQQPNNLDMGTVNDVVNFYLKGGQ